MDVEQLDNGAGCASCRPAMNGTAAISCAAAACVLIIAHCIMAKYFCSCKKNLKQRIKELKEEE